MLVATLSPPVHAQPPTGLPRHRMHRPTETARTQPLFGVMGAIQRPGVYASDTPTPLLVEVVGKAGGLTESATGNIRIVRGGRSGQQTFYSSGLEFRLQPGDLVVADSRPIGASRHSSGITATSNTDAGVQLAFLELLDRPVVLRMRRDDASINRILTLLNQPASLASTIRVVETGPTYTRGVRNENTQLANGSVLVFNGENVDRVRLPSLPPVIVGTETENEAGTTRREVEVPIERPEPRPFDAPPSQPVTSRSDDGVPASTASLSRRHQYPLPLLRTTPAPVPLPAEAAGVVERPLLPSLDPEPIAESATSEPATRIDVVTDAVDETPEPNVPAESFLDGGPNVTADVPLPEPAKANQPAVASPESATQSTPEADTGSLAIVLVVLFVAAGMIWLLSRRSEHVGSMELGDTVPETTAEPVSAPATRYRIDAAESTTVTLHSRTRANTPLDDLIADRVPFQEEPVSLPSGLEMFGKPTTTVRHRLDEPENRDRNRGPRRPHIVRQLVEAVAAEQETPVESETAPRKTADVPNSIDRRSARLLDRALTAVHGARQS